MMWVRALFRHRYSTFDVVWLMAMAIYITKGEFFTALAVAILGAIASAIITHDVVGMDP